MVRNEIYIYVRLMIVQFMAVLIPLLTILKLIGNSNSYLRSMNLISMSWLNLGLIAISLAFLMFSLTALLNSDFKSVMFMLILFHWLTFYTSDFILILMLSDLIIIIIAVAFRLTHKSNYDFSSNLYLIYYILLPSAPLLTLILIDLQKGLSIREISNYFNNFNLNNVTRIIILIMLLSGMAKLPVYRLHYWLPKAHVQAPTILSIILARLSLKVRLIIFSFVLPSMDCSLFLLYLVSRILFLRLVCSTYARVSSSDFKVFLAYCSVAHITLSCIGIMTMSMIRFKRRWLIRLAHCLTSPFLFYIVGNTQYNSGTRNTTPVGTNKQTFVMLSLLVIILIDLPFPPIFSFWGEVSIINSLYNSFIYTSILIVIPFILILRRYESVYRSLKNYICTKTVSILLRSFIIRVIARSI